MEKKVKKESEGRKVFKDPEYGKGGAMVSRKEVAKHGRAVKGEKKSKEVKSTSRE